MTIHHLSGKENLAADWLSRNPPKEEPEKLNLLNLNATSIKKEEIKKIHEENGHPGISAMISTLSRFYKKKGLRNLIRGAVKGCYMCQTCKTSKYKYGEQGNSLETTVPLQDISTDVYGPFPSKNFITKIKAKNLFLITFTDRCSRYTKVSLSTSITSLKIKQALEKSWIRENGYPKSILSDQGRCYSSREFKEYCKERGIIHIMTSPYNPTGNSISERINGVITSCLRIYKGDKITKILKIIEKRIN